MFDILCLFYPYTDMENTFVARKGKHVTIDVRIMNSLDFTDAQCPSSLTL